MIIWPPHVPIVSFTGIGASLHPDFNFQRIPFWAVAALLELHGAYARSEVGATFKARQDYRLVYLAGVKKRNLDWLLQRTSLEWNGHSA